MKRASEHILKYIPAIMVFAALLLLVSGSGGKKAARHVGVNAEILEISKELKGMVVKGLDINSILGEKCYINCESEEAYFLYANNNTGELSDLDFSDFIAGDEITVDIDSVENEYAQTYRVQLLTQRK